MQGFTRTTYDNGYKYTMIYPPGWTQGDPRQPEVHKERCVPGPSRAHVATFEQRPYPEHGHIPDRQPRSTSTSTAATSRHPRVGAHTSTGPEPPKRVQRARKTAWSHSLKTYLAQAWMPRYVLDAQVDTSVRFEWPILRVLGRSPRTRTLYLVQRILDWDLRHAVDELKEALGDAQLTSTLAEVGKIADLTLPDTACRSLDEHDATFLDGCRLSTPSDVTTLLQAYPLGTVIKAIKLFFNLPDDHKVSMRMKFNDVNHLCPARHADLFDLIALPGYEIRPDDLSLLIVSVTPWDIKYDDLEEFARVGVPDGDLDLPTDALPFPVDVLRAVIWDICLKHNCRFFILTTYDEWVFGSLSADMHRGRMTTHLRAPIFPRDMTVSARDVAQPCFPVPNVFECLLLWILTAVDDDHTWWPLPPEMPSRVNPRELSALDGGWKDLDNPLL